ncbi:MAG: hypothetical protein QG604_675 [Candidatus Dependentiae bacterium]|nr:hypothetical protein [Candidatus Dependentiae bacterium]
MNGAYRYFLILLGAAQTLCAMNPLLTIETQRLWKPFHNHNPASTHSIIGYSTITFINRGNAPLNLHQFALSWKPALSLQGKEQQFKPFIPLLYKQEKLQPLRPNASSHLAHGIWNPVTKTITFKFKEPYKLVGTAEVSLVMQTPQSNLPTLQHGGSFTYNDNKGCHLIIKGDRPCVL